MSASEKTVSFQKTIYNYYWREGRILPWRNTKNPYHIVVSEFMLQQTQVERVLEKYPPFIEAFPDFQSLAHAEFADVLRAWQGLGYNRRALMLRNFAQEIIEKYDGAVPQDQDKLCSLPGIGKATAGSIITFAFNIPTVFIETNIRRVFIHEFFQDNTAVKDREIMPFVEQTLDRESSREWYYALMDYGSMLKKKVENPNRRSAHYRKQPPFYGSDRMIRGVILKKLLERPYMTNEEIVKAAGSETETERIKGIIEMLGREGFVKEQEGRYSIK